MTRSTRASLGLLALALVGALTLAPPLLYAQVCEAHQDSMCGTTLTISYTLHHNIDCSQMTGFTTPALTLGADSIVLHLNGYTICGPYPTVDPNTQVTGVSTTQNGGPDGQFTTIEGPGTITGFYDGIDLGTDSNRVKHVHLVSNYGVGIYVYAQRNTVENNTIVGSGAGIIVNNSPNNIIGNAITQMPGVGVGVGMGTGIVIEPPGYCSVRHNTVTNNSVGLLVDSATGDYIAGNDFSSNAQDGIDVQGAQSDSLLNNQTNANGQDGISLLDVGGVLVQNNTTNSNGRRGIGLASLYGMSANTSIKGNRALGNNPLQDPNTWDLFWDGVGTGNTWTFNVCDTYSLTISPKPC